MVEINSQHYLNVKYREIEKKTGFHNSTSEKQTMIFWSEFWEVKVERIILVVETVFYYNSCENEQYFNICNFYFYIQKNPGLFFKQAQNDVKVAPLIQFFTLIILT